MFSRSLISTALLAVSITAAQAADDSSSSSNVDWSGLYMGGVAGYAWGDSRHTDTTGATSGDFDIDGAIGGLTVGYNILSGSSFIYGVEADISFSNIDGSTSNGCLVICSTEVDWLGTVRARAGFDADGFMPYVTGGLAFGDVSATTGVISASDVKVGWTVGAGVEFVVADNWTVKGEYLYVDLGDLDVPTPTPVKAESKFGMIRIGFNYKF